MAIPGQQFADWTQVPSLIDSLNKQQQPGIKNPLMSAIGYGIESMLGRDNTLGQQFQGNVPVGANVPPSPIVQQPAVPNQAVAPITRLDTPTLAPLTVEPTDYRKFLYSR